LQGEGFDVPTWQGLPDRLRWKGLASAPMGGGFGAAEGMAHKGRLGDKVRGAAAFASGEPRTPPDSIKSVAAKAQWVRGWDEAAANVLKTAEDATGAAVAVGAQQPDAQAWTTSEGAAPVEAAESGTAVASPPMLQIWIMKPCQARPPRLSARKFPLNASLIPVA
jgi:hypothetical protein